MSQEGGETGYRLPQLFFDMLFVAFLYGMFIYFAHVMTSQGMDTATLDAMILSKRILYSPNSLAYRDTVTGRVYPGIIDLEKFDQERFGQAFSLGKKHVAARIAVTLLDSGKSMELFINQKWYNRWSPYASFDQFKDDIHTTYILARDNQGEHPAIIKIHVVANE